MSHFHRQGTKLLSQTEPSEDQPRSPFADVAGRFANWITGLDRVHEPAGGDDAADPLRALLPDAESDSPADATPGAGPRVGGAGPAAGGAPALSRFPLSPLGYSRTAVDEHLEELERELADLGRELADLRSRHEAPMTVTEELERIGEQTASILVVAHNKASETTRRAQEQAERCIADAAANAVAITEEAKQRLQQLDSETDAVWRERERLLEDVRAVSAALTALADQASERFPADQSAPGALPAPAGRGARSGVGVFDPQSTQPFTPVNEAAAQGEPSEQLGPLPGADAGDTAGWLAGFEPPVAGESDGPLG